MISPELYLTLHNVTVMVSIAVMMSVALFVFFKGWKQEANIALSFCIVFIAVFFASHLVGINIADPELSKRVLVLNILIVFIGTFNLHAIWALFNKSAEKRVAIIIIHSCAILVSACFFVFPDLFLLDSVPKMYFPNYYNPASLNIIRMVILFGMLVPYCFYELYSIYKSTSDAVIRMQVKYFAITMFAGYTVGFFPNLLVYDIKIDPLLGAPAAIFFSVPLLYGMVQYKMFNILIIAKKAFYYALMVGAVGLGIALLNYSTNQIENYYPDFPIWVLYILSSVLILLISALVWKKLKESDQLKYEFITTITHKLRTPMTGIRWATESLSGSDLPSDIKDQVRYIAEENSKLIDLTNVLVGISNEENRFYEYKIRRGDISKVLDEVIDSLKLEIESKGQTIKKEYASPAISLFDENRIKFVIQILIENAIRYSPKGSSIIVGLSMVDKDMVCKVEDFGIGLSKSEMAKLFSKFYRSEKARKTDTEGLGIGLYVAKEMIFHQRGKIWAESKGENKGSIFYFSLPIR